VLGKAPRKAVHSLRLQFQTRPHDGNGNGVSQEKMVAQGKWVSSRGNYICNQLARLQPVLMTTDGKEFTYAGVLKVTVTFLLTYCWKRVGKVVKYVYYG
jgi:hypothetical protein